VVGIDESKSYAECIACELEDFDTEVKSALNYSTRREPIKRGAD
jgi:hypothetical protein